LSDVPGFFVAQLVGALLALLVSRYIFHEREKAAASMLKPTGQ
jgi:hypothetical protein